MRRLVPLLGAVLALSLSGTAAADTFVVVHSQHAHGNTGAIGFRPGARSVSFTQVQAEPMTFAALRPIWEAAGSAYGIPWEVLAAINKVETGFGRNLGPSSAGAVGWMQFLPSTWARWGVDANGDGIADPDNPTDAIFSAARYLAACGGQFDIARAVYSYNHSARYVREVLGLAALYARGGDAFASLGRLPAVGAAHTQIAAAKRQLAPALAKARTLARAERRAFHRAAKAKLLSDQLADQKRAVQLGVRRVAAEQRVARLRKVLHNATTQLARLKDLSNGFSGGAPELVSTPGFFSGNGPVPTGAGGGVASIALQYLGIPYLWGGATPNGFDCSGLVTYVFAQVGVFLPHNTVALWNSPQAVPVAPDELQPGDLVFFNGFDHVGIYLGNGYFIDAPHTGTVVRIDSLSEPWYAAKYDGAKRIVGAQLDSFTGAGAMSFTTSADTVAFTPNVVYFTH
jgi:cell wall-associated NlpC family hydrolase